MDDPRLADEGEPRASGALSARVPAIAGEMRQAKTGEFVFPGGRAGKPLSNRAMAAVLKRMGRHDITAHGFRSSFRDWAGETTAFPREVIEHALAHQLRDKAEAAYARGDLMAKRRQLMDAWAGYCECERDPLSPFPPPRRALGRPRT